MSALRWCPARVRGAVLRLLRGKSQQHWSRITSLAAADSGEIQPCGHAPNSALLPGMRGTYALRVPQDMPDVAARSW
jgi:hypothetical protein